MNAKEYTYSLNDKESIDWYESRPTLVKKFMDLYPVGLYSVGLYSVNGVTKLLIGYTEWKDKRGIGLIFEGALKVCPECLHEIIPIQFFWKSTLFPEIPVGAPIEILEDL